MRWSSGATSTRSPVKGQVGSGDLAHLHQACKLSAIALYERLRALGFHKVFETNSGLVHTPDRTKANMRAYMRDKMKDWLLHGAIETDEKMAMDLAGPGYHINRSNLLVLESKADMQKRGQASPDDGDALALTFAQPVEPAEVEEEDEEEAFGRYSGSSSSGGWMR
jgi:hypothetical protein